MRLRLAAGAVLVMVAGGRVASLEAQVLGLPVYNNGVPSGLGLYGDAGFTNSTSPGGKGTAFGVTARLGLGALGFSASVSSLNPDGPRGGITSYGGTANLRLIGGPLIPFSATLQAGYGRATTNGTTIQQIPVGLGIGITIPNPVLAIRPWVAPRAHFTRFSEQNGESDNDVNFGASAGVEFNFLNGIGAHVSYDRIFTGNRNPVIWGVGLHYAFRIPGL